MLDIASPPAGSSATLLALWARGLAHTGPTRTDVVLQASGKVPAPRTLGARNISLLELHADLFGERLELRSHCPSCGTAVEFSSDSRALAARLPKGAAAPSHRIDIEGYAIEFRVLSSADLIDASRSTTESAFVTRLLERCVLTCTRAAADVAVRDVPETVLDRLSQQMEALDPAARVSFAVECPHCAAAWDAQLDIDQLVWTKVQAAAERLLLEIDTLARAYGWTERDVLELDPLRRAAYLQLVNG